MWYEVGGDRGIEVENANDRLSRYGIRVHEVKADIP